MSDSRIFLSIKDMDVIDNVVPWFLKTVSNPSKLKNRTNDDHPKRLTLCIYFFTSPFRILSAGNQVVFYGIQILSVFIVISSKLPIAIGFIFVMSVIYCFMFKVFLKTLIVSKRLELQTRTSLYMRFEELSTGLSVIHAYDKTKAFTETLNQQLEANTKCTYMLAIGFRWLALRNDIISILIVVVTALLSIYFSDTIDGGSAGM